MYCIKCGKEIRDDVPFCGFCGSAVQSQKLICPKCGRELEADMLFCSYCGVRGELEPSASGPKPEAPEPQKPEPPRWQAPPRPEPPRYQVPPQPEPPRWQAPPRPEPPRYQAPPRPEPPRWQAPPQPEAPRYQAPPQPEPPRWQAPPQPEAPGWQDGGQFQGDQPAEELMKLPVQWSPGDEQQEKLRYENEGKLFLYNEAIVYKATFTHGAELAFGLVGLAASHSKAKNSDALIFPMDQIVCIRDGMHRSKLPYMVIEMRDGEKHLFVPALTVSENLKFTKFKAFSERKQEFMELVRTAQSILQARRY